MTEAGDLLVDRSDFSKVTLTDSLSVDAPLADGRVMLEVEFFGLTANNVSYASAGDMLGYWNFFPADDNWGRVPVWGFANVVRSEHPDIEGGEQVFGYLPMGRRFIVEPNDVDAMCFSDRFEHRAALHPWYNRYYRVAGDPVSATGHRGLQPILWALHLTGWQLSADFGTNAEHGADTVLVASASSRTAYAFAHSMRARATEAKVVGITSAGNVEFVESLDVYDEIVTYDDIDAGSFDGQVALVDMAGNQTLVGHVHTALGDRLVASILVGGTHRGAGSAPAELPGPARRFFFIPDEAEAQSAALGHGEYHARSAQAWRQFVEWVDGRFTITTAQGPGAVRDGWLTLISDGATAGEAATFSY